MASKNARSSVPWRALNAALLALLLFLYEQALLDQPAEVQLGHATAEAFVVSGGLQWLLTVTVLLVSFGFFSAVIRGIGCRTAKD